MDYSGYVVVLVETGAIVGGYPREGTEAYHTRLGSLSALDPSLYAVVRIEGKF